MIKVLCVDDEPMVHEVLRTKVPWDAYNMSIVGSAASGKEALDYIERHEVDVVFTDIRMPQMDGNALIAHLSKSNPEIKLVVLSSYSEFSSVKKAFVDGAMDYILKEDIGSAAMLEVLQKLKNEAFERGAGSIEEAVKETIASSTALKSFRLYVLAYIKLHDKRQIASVQAELAGCGEARAYPSFPWQHGIVVLHGLADPHDTSPIQLLAQMAASAVPSFTGEWEIGISRPGTLTECRLLFQQAHQAIRRKYYEPDETLFVYEEESCPAEQLRTDEIKKELRTSFKYYRIGQIHEIMEDVLRFMDNHRLDKLKVVNELTDIYVYMVSLLLDYGLVPKQVVQQHSAVYDQLVGKRTFAEIRDWVYANLEEIDRNCQHEKNNNTIQLVMNYIGHHYEEDLSLGKLARRFGMSESYLSRSFSKEAGLKFTEYVNLIRIENAKKYLLHTDARIAEVSSKVGYANVEHFSRVFKQMAGVSPSVYQDKSDQISNMKYHS